jgi:hypothetical protein
MVQLEYPYYTMLLFVFERSYLFLQDVLSTAVNMFTII